MTDVHHLPVHSGLQDPCPNAHVRQQTGAAFLPDCRAYELVSAANTGGYDVESYLVAGQEPFGGYPRAWTGSSTASTTARSRARNPTNHGSTPTRDPRRRRLEHRLRRHPRRNPHATTPSPRPSPRPTPTLDTFAFGGPEICSPCFADGTTGIPLRCPTAAWSRGWPVRLRTRSATPDGLVRSASPPTATTSSSARPRNSRRTPTPTAPTRRSTTATSRPDTTHVVSTRWRPLPASRMPMHSPRRDGIAELDISSDGSRIVIGSWSPSTPPATTTGTST